MGRVERVPLERPRNLSPQRRQQISRLRAEQPPGSWGDLQQKVLLYLRIVHHLIQVAQRSHQQIERRKVGVIGRMRIQAVQLPLRVRQVPCG